MKTGLLHLLGRWMLITASLSLLLFMVAGTTRIASIRAYLEVFSILLLVTMLRVDPRLSQERVHPGRGDTDNELRFAAGLFFLLTLIVAAFSVGRLRLAFSVPIPFRKAALSAFAFAGFLQTWAMILNPFFSRVIRLQTECGHRVIQHGPYRFMRHPGYFGMSIGVPASALAIGSWLALIPAAAFSAIILRRAWLEDEFLRRYLFGYQAYATRVRNRVFPQLLVSNKHFAHKRKESSNPKSRCSQ